MSEKNEFIKSILAGAFFLVGIIATTIFVFSIGNEKGIAKQKFSVQVMYHNVGGLLEGAPVRLAGVVVGSVAGIEFAPKSVQGRKVVVTIDIFEKFHKELNNTAQFAIKTEGILGEKLIEVDIGEGNQPIDASKPLIGEDPIDMQDMAMVFEAAAKSLTETSESLSNVDVEEIAKVMGETADALLVTSEGLNKMFQDLQYITTKTRRLLNRLEQKIIEGNLFKVF